MIRPAVKKYADKLELTAKEALELPKAVEGEQHGFACYIYTPGESNVSSVWQEVKEKCLPDANPAELMVILKSIHPLYGQNDSFRGRTGPCGDYEDITCPLKYIYDDVWYCVKERVGKMSFSEMKQVPDAWTNAELPSYITDYNDEYSLVPSQCWINDYDIEWPPDEASENEKAEFALSIFIKKAPKSAVKIERIFSLMNNSEESIFTKYRIELYRALKNEQELWTFETIMALGFPIFQRTAGTIGKDIAERFINSKLFFNRVLNQIVPSNCKFYSLMKQVPYNYEFLMSMPDELLFKTMSLYWDNPAMKLIFNNGIKGDVYYLSRILFSIAGHKENNYNSFFQAAIKILSTDSDINGEKISNAVEKILSDNDFFPADEAEWFELLNHELSAE